MVTITTLSDYLIGNSWPLKSGPESFSGAVCGRESRSRAYREVFTAYPGKILWTTVD
jgi:hypothetical protein